GGNDGIAAGDELPSDLGRSSHHEAGREKPVLAEVAVVRNMTNVVELAPGTDMRRRQGRTIDGAIAADFHSIPDFDVAQMRDLARLAVRIHGIAESIAADTGMRMKFAIFADLAGGADKHL